MQQTQRKMHSSFLTKQKHRRDKTDKRSNYVFILFYDNGDFMTDVFPDDFYCYIRFKNSTKIATTE